MDPRRHFIEDSECELYHRGSYGHGCEADRWPYGGSGYPSSTYLPAAPNKKDWLPQVPLLPPVRPTIVTITTTTFRPFLDGYTPANRPPIDVPGHSIFTPTSKPYLPPDPVYPGHKNRGTFRPPVYLPPKEKPPSGWPVTGYDMNSASRKMDKRMYTMEKQWNR